MANPPSSQPPSTPPTRQPLLTFILLAYGIIGLLYATYIPAWQAPDEPAHYNYIRQLSAGQLPKMEPTDYDQTYQNEMISNRFANFNNDYAFSYEDWQPPVYYALLTPIFWLTDGDLISLRMASFAISLFTAYLVWAIVRQLWPERPWRAYTALAFFLFLPQHLSIMATLNNDTLAELLIAATLWLTLPWLNINAPEPTNRQLIFQSIILGLALTTKGTAYFLAPLLAIALLWRYRRDGRGALRPAVLLFMPAWIIASLWWRYNLTTYGGGDLLAMNVHDAVVTGQPRTAQWITDLGLLPYLRRFITTTFNSFWGQFGWMSVPMPTWVYQPLWLFTFLILTGIIYHLRHLKPPYTRYTHHALLLLNFLAALGLYLFYNLTFVQHQGRYLFPALIPLAAAVASAVDVYYDWLRPKLHIPPHLFPILLALLLISLDIFALFRFIRPNLLP